MVCFAPPHLTSRWLCLRCRQHNNNLTASSCSSYSTVPEPDDAHLYAEQLQTPNFVHPVRCVCALSGVRVSCGVRVWTATNTHKATLQGGWASNVLPQHPSAAHLSHSRPCVQTSPTTSLYPPTPHFSQLASILCTTTLQHQPARPAGASAHSAAPGQLSHLSQEPTASATGEPHPQAHGALLCLWCVVVGTTEMMLSA